MFSFKPLDTKQTLISYIKTEKLSSKNMIDKKLIRFSNTKKSYSHIMRFTPSELIGPLNDVEKKFAPHYLFLKGNRNLINNHPRVSVIGTRHPSKEGIKNAHELTKFLVDRGVIIVSGLAQGIDSIAHNTAIEEKGKTIAVLGTPLDKCYPRQNAELQNKIMKNHLLLSQFVAGTPIQRKNFPMRNRTMALLSHLSIIVEAGEKSGTLHQGWEALRLGRPLFIMEDIVKNKNLTWPNKLIEYGAEILFTSQYERIIDFLPNEEEVDLCSLK